MRSPIPGLVALCLAAVPAAAGPQVVLRLPDAAPRPAAQPESRAPADQTAAIEELKETYLRCELAALSRVMAGEDAMACSVAYEELKRIAFGGDAGRLRDWSAPLLAPPPS